MVTTFAASIPDKIKNNALIAIGKGVGKLITAGLEVPTAYLEGITQGIRNKTEGEQFVAKSAAKAASKVFSDDDQLQQRAVDYFARRIVNEQENREQIAQLTMENLTHESINKDAAETIDEDWLTVFWRLAETKSSKDIQVLLAKLLCREIVQPRSVSPHTLQLLSILTSDLAKAFERLCRISIDDGKSAYVIHPHVFPFKEIGPLDAYDVSYEDLFDLDGARLLRSAEALLVDYAADDNATFEKVDFAGKPALLNLAGKQVHLLQFTRAGRELRCLIALQPNAKYEETLRQRFQETHFRIQ